MTRRFFQFSLGSLLVFVALICVVLAVRSNRQHNRRVAIAKIESLGGKIGYSSEWSKQSRDDTLVLAWMRGGRIAELPKIGPLARLFGDAPSTTVVSIYFNEDGKLTDADLGSVLSLPEVQIILVGANPVTETGLMNLASLPDLKWVYLTGNTNVTDDGIARLQKALPNCCIVR
jgi:hypothetical protein